MPSTRRGQRQGMSVLLALKQFTIHLDNACYGAVKELTLTQRAIDRLEDEIAADSYPGGFTLMTEDPEPGVYRFMTTRGVIKVRRQVSPGAVQFLPPEPAQAPRPVAPNPQARSVDPSPFEWDMVASMVGQPIPRTSDPELIPGWEAGRCNCNLCLSARTVPGPAARAHQARGL